MLSAVDWMSTENAHIGSVADPRCGRLGGKTLKKSGYKTWQRKIKLSGGEIKINAVLEKN